MKILKKLQQKLHQKIQKKHLKKIHGKYLLSLPRSSRNPLPTPVKPKRTKSTKTADPPEGAATQDGRRKKKSLMKALPPRPLRRQFPRKPLQTVPPGSGIAPAAEADTEPRRAALPKRRRRRSPSAPLPSRLRSRVKQPRRRKIIGNSIPAGEKRAPAELLKSHKRPVRFFPCSENL